MRFNFYDKLSNDLIYIVCSVIANVDRRHITALLALFQCDSRPNFVKASTAESYATLTATNSPGFF